MNLDQLISVFEGASLGGRAVKPGGLDCDILTTMKSLRKDKFLQGRIRSVHFSHVGHTGVPRTFKSASS